MTNPQQAPTPPPPRPPGPPPYHPPADGRGASFYVALLLGFLLFLSAGLNLMLGLVLIGDIGGQLGQELGETTDLETDIGFRVVRVPGGDSGASKQVLRIRVEGAIAEQVSPTIGAEGGTVSKVRRELRLAARTASIAGVVLEINSPGGGVTASEEIHRLITEFKKDTGKPVVAYFGDMSASGGYYIAAACDKIFCRNTTITGSIGVIMSNYNLAGALDKMGIKVESIISPKTPYKDIMSFSRPMRDDERQILLSIIEEMYARFVTVVDDGRPKLSREQVVSLADGRIYSAGQAKENGLVDDVLEPAEVHAEIKKLAGVAQAQLVEQRRVPTLGDLLFSGPAMRGGDMGTGEVLRHLATHSLGARFLYFWPGGR